MIPTIRPYRRDDLDAVLRLFGETVRLINSRDYDPGQIEAWAPSDRKSTRLNSSHT